MKRRKVYTVKRRWLKGDRVTYHRVFRGGTMILELVEENGGIIIHKDVHGSSKALMSGPPSPMPQPQDLIAVAILSEEYDTIQAYNYYRWFARAFVYGLVMEWNGARFGSEEVFEGMIQAKQALRDAKPANF